MDKRKKIELMLENTRLVEQLASEKNYGYGLKEKISELKSRIDSKDSQLIWAVIVIVGLVLALDIVYINSLADCIDCIDWVD